VPVLQWALTNDLGRIGPGRAQYTHLLDPEDAHVVDDIIVWWVDDDELLVMPNASNTDPIVTTLEGANAAQGGDCTIADITSTRAVLAVQGPQARALLATVSPALAAVPRFEVARVPWGDVACIVAGTGYTGEDGVEIHVPAEHASALWREIVAAGVLPAGLGARDTLRLEAGMNLYGQDMDESIDPLQSGLAWTVDMASPRDFVGKSALAGLIATAAVQRQLLGLVLTAKGGVLRAHQAARTAHGDGEITSGTFSPTLGTSIALARLPARLAPGDEVRVVVRDKELAARAVKPPFARNGKALIA
jgi:aminomethyltransferase